MIPLASATPTSACAVVSDAFVCHAPGDDVRVPAGVMVGARLATGVKVVSWARARVGTAVAATKGPAAAVGVIDDATVTGAAGVVTAEQPSGKVSSTRNVREAIERIVCAYCSRTEDRTFVRYANSYAIMAARMEAGVRPFAFAQYSDGEGD